MLITRKDLLKGIQIAKTLIRLNGKHRGKLLVQLYSLPSFLIHLSQKKKHKQTLAELKGNERADLSR